MQVNWKIVYDVLLYITRDDGDKGTAMISSENLPSRLKTYTLQEILYACNVLAREKCLSVNTDNYQTIFLEKIQDDVCSKLLLEVHNKLENIN